MSEQKAIEIITIQDIYDKVTPDKWQDCVADLYQWLILQSRAKQMQADFEKAMPKIKGIESMLKQRNPHIMYWLDDGNEGLSKIHVEASFNGEIVGSEIIDVTKGETDGK
tara:strand:+ start:1093 stop:1422 length:330 start_codon:yes stop_codon:yes gene_type:complete